MNKHILLGIATLLAALLYACPTDGGSTSGSSDPGINIEEEIKQKDPALVYKADTNESAKALFSRGDLDNPYLFSFEVSTVKNIEAITGEITIIGGGTVLYEETGGTKTAFEFDAYTDYQTYKTTEGMYMLDMSTFRGGAASINAVTADPSYDGTTYIVGIGPDEDNPIDYDTLTDDFSINVRLLHAGEVLKEETVQISKADRYDITSWRDLQHISDDLTGSYEVKNDIIFPELGTYGYENFMPIGQTKEDYGLDFVFEGTFDGNNYEIVGLRMIYEHRFPLGLFGVVRQGTLKNIKIYHKGISGPNYLGGLAGKFWTGVTVDNCHVYALDGAEISIYNVDNLADDRQTPVGGLVGEITNRGYDFTISEIKNSSAHTDVIGKEWVGGLIGASYNWKGGFTVENSYATGNVVGTSRAGGLIGRLDANGLTIIRGYATGDVVGTEHVGGLVGTIYRAFDLVGYATGKVKGSDNVGGVIGTIGRPRWFGNWPRTKNMNTTINAYSLSDVTGKTNVGGVIGFVYTQSKHLDVITYIGYARGEISSSTSQAGLSVGGVDNYEDKPKPNVNGYFSRTTSNFVGVKQNEATGINGNRITISEVNDANYEKKFDSFAFGKEGQWTWESEGKWPALNIGGTAPVDDQPIAPSSYIPAHAKVQETQTDKTLEGIERLEENVFKVYETRSWRSEQQRIENRIPHADFYPTGLYIKPNRTITVTVASDTAPTNLKILAGTYSRYEGENRDPDVFTLKVGKNTITNLRSTPRLIYIRFVDDGWLSDVATVTIHGATKHPYFIRGKTTSKEFQSMLRNYDYDSILIASDRIMMVVSKETALQVRNQDWAKTADLLDKAVETAEYIHGLDSETYYDTPPTTRILAVGRSGEGPMSASHYRISAPKEFAIGWIDNTQIIKDWGLWATIGYMYEPPQILISGMNMNIYSLAIERAFKQESRLVRDGKWSAIKSYLAEPAAKKQFDDIDVFIKLGMFQQLWLGYGSTDEERDKFFINLNKKIRQESERVGWRYDRKKDALAYLMLKSSEVYGYNLNGFFKKWGFQVPKSSFNAVNALGLKNPPVDISALSE